MIGDREHAVPQEAQETINTDKFLQRWQAVAGLVMCVIALATSLLGIYIANQAQLEAIKERLGRTEYQNAISIEDRKDLRVRVDRMDDNLNQINQRLARIETKLDTFANSRK